MHRLEFTLLALALGTGTVAAQAVRALPRGATDAYAGATNFSIPQASFRAQYWFAADNLPPVYLLNQIGLRVPRNTAVAATSRATEILVADTPLPFASVGTNFAQNLGASPTTFFANRTVNFPAQPASTDPNVAATWFPGDAPFLYLGQSLVIDFKSGTGSGGTAVPNDGFVMAPGPTETINLAGRPSCGGVLSASYAAGVLTYTGTGMPASVPVAINFGLENVEQGGIGLPADLTPFGLPGCHLGVFPLASANLSTSAAGQVTLPLNLALPGTSLVLTAQLIHPLIPVPVAVSDFGTSNAVTSTLGFSGVCNALFAAPSTATTAQQGPQPVNNSIVLLLR